MAVLLSPPSSPVPPAAQRRRLSKPYYTPPADVAVWRNCWPLRADRGIINAPTAREVRGLFQYACRLLRKLGSADRSAAAIGGFAGAVVAHGSRSAISRLLWLMLTLESGREEHHACDILPGGIVPRLSLSGGKHIAILKPNLLQTGKQILSLAIQRGINPQSLTTRRLSETP